MCNLYLSSPYECLQSVISHNVTFLSCCFQKKVCCFRVYSINKCYLTINEDLWMLSAINYSVHLHWCAYYEYYVKFFTLYINTMC